MKKHKKTLAIILTLAICFVLIAACGGDTGTAPAPGGPAAPAPASPAPPGAPGAPTAPTGGGGISDAAPEGVRFEPHINVQTDNMQIATINPFARGANISGSSQTFTMIYDRLIERDHFTGIFHPSLATSFETTDFQTFNFTLRDDVYFHNGDKMTAQDVIDTILISRENPGSPGSAQWTLVDTMTATGDYQLELVLSRVHVDFWHNISHPSAGIVSKRAFDADSERGSWIGTGPFTIGDFVTGDFVLFVRNHDYWDCVSNGGTRNIVTESVTLRFIPEVSTRTIMLQNNESQMAMAISSEDIIIFQNDPDTYQVRPQVFNSPNSIAFNLNDPITGDENFRRAVLHALNLEDVGLFATGDWHALNLNGTFWGYAQEFKNEDIPMIPYDLNLARDYLARSVYNGEEVEIAGGNLTHIRASQAIQEQLRLIGINVRLAEFDTAGLTTHQLEGNSQMSVFAPTLDFAAGGIRNLYLPGGSVNRTHYDNPAVTDMLNRAGAITNIAERETVYREIQATVAQDPPISILFYRVNAVLARNSVGGVLLPDDNHRVDMREIYWLVED